jgi:hypothetical protein
MLEWKIEHKGVTYELLRHMDWPKAFPLIQKLFGEEALKYIPSPDVASLAVAKKGEEIIGACFMQLRLHSEPYGALPGENVSPTGFAALFDKCLAPGKEYYAFVKEDDRALDALARAGFKAMPGYVIHSRITRGEN